MILPLILSVKYFLCTTETCVDQSTELHNSNNDEINTLVFEGAHITTVDKNEFIKNCNVTTLKIVNTSLTEFPAGVNYLKKLRHIVYSGNVKTLNLNNLNKLSKSIKKNIVSMQLDENDLLELPWKIGTFVNLKQLSCRHNKIKYLPLSIANLLSLDMLDFWNNEIEELPANFGDLYSLRYLYLGKNKIKKLGTSFTQLQNLFHLNLQDNQLFKFPVELFALNRLKNLNLSGNSFANIHIVKYDLVSLANKIEDDGVTEDKINFVKKLFIKYFIYRKLNEDPQNANNVILSKMECYVLLLEYLSKLKKIKKIILQIEHLVMSGCNLQYIPSFIFNNKKLAHLDLSNNQITKFPTELYSCNVLTSLDLSHNQLTVLPFIDSPTFSQNLVFNLQNNFISVEDIKDVGYGIKSIKNMGFRRLNIEKQQDVDTDLNFNMVCHNMQNVKLYWNLQVINKLKMLFSTCTQYKNISDSEALDIWNAVIKFFVSDNGDESAFFDTAVGNIDSEIGKVITSIKQSKIKNHLCTFLKSQKSDMKMSVHDISAVFLCIFDKNQLYKKTHMKNCIKMIFGNYLYEIFTACDDIDELVRIKSELKGIFEHVFVEKAKKIEEYLPNYYFSNQYADRYIAKEDIREFIKVNIANIKEVAFSCAVLAECKYDECYIEELRYIFRDKLGVQSDIVYPENHGKKQINIPTYKLQVILQKFFEFFNVETVLFTIMDEINKHLSLVYSADSLLKEIIMCEFDQVIHSTNSEASLMDKKIKEHMHKYMEYQNSQISNDSKPLMLKYAGMKKLCVHLHLIVDTETSEMQ